MEGDDYLNRRVKEIMANDELQPKQHEPACMPRQLRFEGTVEPVRCGDLVVVDKNSTGEYVFIKPGDYAKWLGGR